MKRFKLDTILLIFFLFCSVNCSDVKAYVDYEQCYMEYIDEMCYPAISEMVSDAYPYVNYAIFDIDKDGVPELILSYVCNPNEWGATHVYEVHSRQSDGFIKSEWSGIYPDTENSAESVRYNAQERALVIRGKFLNDITVDYWQVFKYTDSSGEKLFGQSLEIYIAHDADQTRYYDNYDAYGFRGAWETEDHPELAAVFDNTDTIPLIPFSPAETDLSKAEIILSSESFTYTGNTIEPTVTVKINGTILNMGTDYEVTYENNIAMGSARVLVSGIGKFSGVINKEYRINAVDLEKEANVSLSKMKYNYSGKAKKPAVTVKIGKQKPKAGKDYTVSYSNNINAGDGTVTVTGKGMYTGTIRKTFKIKALSITKKAKVSLGKSVYNYTGKAIKPSVTVKYGTKKLKKNRDYKVSYSNNKKAGTATVKISGTGNYAGKVSKKFTIKAKAITGKSNVNVMLDAMGGKCSKKYLTIADRKRTGLSLRYTLPTPQRKGYKFQGWYKSKIGGKKVTGKDVEIIENSKKLYALWKPIKYSITYFLNGGTNAGENPGQYTVEDIVTLHEPTKEGFIFKGWYSSVKLSSKSKLTSSKKSNLTKACAKGTTGNKKFYAKWKEIEYEIIFDANGLNAAMPNNIACKYTQTVSLPSVNNTRFIGWNTMSDGTGTFYASAQEISGLTLVNHEKVKLYAQYRKVDLSRRYILSAEETSGWNYTSSPEIAQKLDMIFAGHAGIYDAAGKEVNVRLGSFSVPDNGIHLYACNKLNSGTSCWIYANAVYYTLFGEALGNGDQSYRNSKKVSAAYGMTTASYDSLRKAGVRDAVGAYIRTSTHSMIVLAYDESGISILEGNADGYGGGLVRISNYSWAEFNKYILFNGTKMIEYIIQPY